MKMSDNERGQTSAGISNGFKDWLKNMIELTDIAEKWRKQNPDIPTSGISEPQ